MRELDEHVRHRPRLRAITVMEIGDLQQKPVQRLEIVDVVLDIRDDEVGVARGQHFGDPGRRNRTRPDAERRFAGGEQRDDVVLRFVGSLERGPDRRDGESQQDSADGHARFHRSS